MVPSMVTLSYFRDPFWDPCRTVLWNEAGAYSFAKNRVLAGHTNIQTRTSYLGTGVAD